MSVCHKENRETSKKYMASHLLHGNYDHRANKSKCKPAIWYGCNGKKHLIAVCLKTNAKNNTSVEEGDGVGEELLQIESSKRKNNPGINARNMDKSEFLLDYSEYCECNKMVFTNCKAK